MIYIKTLEQANIVQPIFGSSAGDDVRVTLQRLSDNKYYNFGTYEFQTDSIYGTMTLQGNSFWKAVFTPPQDDAYLVSIEDMDLKFISRGQFDTDYENIVKYEYPTTQFFQVYESVAGGVIDTGWTPVTKIAICNLSLRMLKLKTIKLLDEDNASARELTAIYDQTLKELLSEHPWNFSIKRVALVLLEETPTYGFAHVYSLPEDYMRILETEKNTKYQVENNKLLSDQATLNIMYIAFETDPEIYTHNFIAVFALKLAIEMCYPLTGNTTLLKDLKKEYFGDSKNAGRLGRAKSVDGQEGTPRKIDESSHIDSRGRSVANGYD